MSKYTFCPRLFIVRKRGKEYPIITIDGCEPDDTMYYFRKDENITEEEGIVIALAVRDGEYNERLFDDICHYDVDVWGYETMMNMYSDVVEGCKKAIAVI